MYILGEASFTKTFRPHIQRHIHAHTNLHDRHQTMGEIERENQTPLNDVAKYEHIEWMN